MDRTTLRDTVSDLRRRMADLPKISHELGDLMDQHRRHRAAAKELAHYLSTTYGARVNERHDTNRITMHRISSTSTSGLHGAFLNWITAAERKASALEKQP